jgi:hypothetical protein
MSAPVSIALRQLNVFCCKAALLYCDLLDGDSFTRSRTKTPGISPAFLMTD